MQQRATKPVIERLMAKLAIAESGCWEWQGGTAGRGYGVISRGRKGEGLAYVHRISYEHHHGEIPVGMTVDHLCRNVCCVNPEHLRLLTRSENSRNTVATLRTHCPHGHEYDLLNTSFRRGKRECRTCNRERKRKAA